MNHDLRPRVYRIATATRPARQVSAEPAMRAGRWHQIGDRVLYGYESEELAAASLSHMTQGIEPARLVHETLILPANPALHADYQVEGNGRSRRAHFAPAIAQLPIVNLTALMQQNDLLSLWVTSPFASQQRTVLLNVLHPAFAQVEIHSHVMDGGSFFAPAACGAKPEAARSRGARSFTMAHRAPTPLRSVAC